jgi:hypothetical protein
MLTQHTVWSPNSIIAFLPSPLFRRDVFSHTCVAHRFYPLDLAFLIALVWSMVVSWGNCGTNGWLARERIMACSAVQRSEHLYSACNTVYHPTIAAVSAVGLHHQTLQLEASMSLSWSNRAAAACSSSQWRSLVETILCHGPPCSVIIQHWHTISSFQS